MCMRAESHQDNPPQYSMRERQAVDAACAPMNMYGPCNALQKAYGCFRKQKVMTCCWPGKQAMVCARGKRRGCRSSGLLLLLVLVLHARTQLLAGCMI